MAQLLGGSTVGNYLILSKGNHYNLEHHDNVNITSIADGEILTWDNTNSYWKNETLAEAGIQAAGAIGNATLTLATAGTGLSGSQTFTANATSGATFTVTSNATNANTASTIVARDASGNFSAGTITANLTGTASSATWADTVDVNTSDSATWYNMVWHSGDTLYSSTGVQYQGSTDSLRLADNSHFYLGTGNDLDIYHDGTHSYLNNSGGRLYLRTTISNNIIFSTNNVDRWEIYGSNGDLMPDVDSTYNIGSSTLRPAIIYADNFNAASKISVTATAPEVLIHNTAASGTYGMSSLILENNQSSTGGMILTNPDWGALGLDSAVVIYSNNGPVSFIDESDFSKTLTITESNTVQLNRLTTNGFVKTSGGDGTLSIDTNTYLTGNQTITLSGDVSGSGTTSITCTVADNSHSHLWANISDKPSTFAPSAHTLDSHSNVTITSIASGEILKWNGSAWINNTLAEAGIQPAGSYITASGVTYENLSANGDIGTGAAQVAQGNHTHSYLANLSEDTTPQLGGNLGMNGKGLILESQTIDAGVSTGNLVYYDGTDWNQTDADAESSASKMLGIYLGSNAVLIYGIWTTTGLTNGSIYYVSTAGGGITTTAPSATGDIVRVIGYAVSTTQLFFNPDGTFVEIA